MEDEILQKEQRRKELQNARSKKYYEKNKQKVLEKQKKYRVEVKQKVVEIKQKRKEHLQEVEPIVEPIAEPIVEPIQESSQITFIKRGNKIFNALNLTSLETLVNHLEKAELTKKKIIDDAKILFRILDVDQLHNVLKNHKKVIKIIENSKSQQNTDYSNNTKKGLIQLVLIIVDNKWLGNIDQKEREKLHKEYKRLFDRLDFVTREQTKQNKNILLHDIDDYVQKVKDKFGEESKHFLVAKLYQESARRDDFKLQIINNISQATDTSVNYILVPPTRTVCETIINSHKTSKKFEPLVKKLSVYLSNLIKKYIIEHNLKIGGFLLGKSSLSPFVSKMSAEIGLPGITINTLRKMAITKFLSVPRSLEERQQLASEFGHSLAMQENTYRGTLINP
jgi:hypothetical protein